MESEVARFLKDFIQLNTVLFLCFYTVRDSLRMPMRRIASYSLSFVTLFCLVITIIYWISIPYFFSLLGLVLFLVGGAALLFNAASHEKGKLAFILLLIFSYYFFTDNIGNILCLLLNIHLYNFTYQLTFIYILCLALTVYPFARFMGWLWACIRGLRETSWSRLCLVPLAFTIMCSMYWEFFVAEMIAGWAFPVFEIAIIVCAFIVYWQIADGLAKAADAARFAERLRSTDNQLLLQAELLKEVASHDGEVRQLRHDMRHHFSILETMLTENAGDRAMDYLREYIIRVEETATPPVCENAVTDAVCRRYIALAGERDIKTDIAVSIPTGAGVADSDLAVLLGNLWENAIEACGRQAAGERYIRLRAKCTENSLIISMTNSFDGVTRANTGKNGEPVLLSLKRGGTEEGIGLASIRAIVGRYHGLEEVNYDADSFHVKILLYTANP
ncbi:MAG: GHKL domain-containing protein [Clostridiales bacterium]|jgi:hypothetical protein|nr:GHKL domain-containing protein [Clostridiales bacterium]